MSRINTGGSKLHEIEYSLSLLSVALAAAHCTLHIAQAVGQPCVSSLAGRLVGFAVNR